MPTMPTLTSNWNCRATPPSRVKSATPFPYGLSFTSRSASSYVGDADDREHGPEDLVPVGVHLGRHVVEQRDAEEEAAVVGRRLAAVGDEGRALAQAPLSRYDATLSRCSRVTSGPISEAGSRPSPTFTFGSRSLIALDELVARVADGDDHGDRHAALSGRAVAGAHCGVRGHVDVRVREDDHVVLRAAEGLHALAVPSVPFS